MRALDRGLTPLFLAGMALAVTCSAGGCAGRTTKTPAPAATLRSASQPAAGTHAHEPIAPLEEAAKEARKLDGLGTYGRRVTTSSPEAQAFFDQGMRLYWAFNHDEAYRSFARAAVIDPRCMMCFWGAALALGPNYNMPMFADRAQVARDALQRALDLSASAPPLERALAGALERRYPTAEPADARTMLRRSRAYADAMREVARQYPADTDVLSLFAESVMVLNPWKLWTRSGSPAEGTLEIVSVLETALAKDSSHPGANHLYIHAVEASSEPAKALPAAERLPSMMPNAGHIVHMPAHIYQRIGRYEAAAEANRRAIEADRRYIDEIAPRPPPKVYGMYIAHNAQFLAFSDSMLGRSGEAIEAAQSGGRISKEAATAMPTIEHFAALPHVMMLRFGKWSNVLTAPPPDPSYRTANGLWHHARGMSLAAIGRANDAEIELEKVKAIAREVPPEHVAMQSAAKDVLAIAVLVLEGKIAEKRGDLATAIARLEDAVCREDALSYDEPPDWWYPVRHVLGAVHLSAARARDAESVYRADLTVNPENGWALAGLAKSLEMQGKRAEAQPVWARAHAAWQHADIPLQGSWLDAP